jgi:limonene-1,2-epoxide hydrolase
VAQFGGLCFRQGEGDSGLQRLPVLVASEDRLSVAGGVLVGGGTMILALLNKNISTWGITEFAIAIVAIAAVAALVYVALRKFEIAIPGWVVQVFWICVVAFVIIMAIRFVANL